MGLTLSQEVEGLLVNDVPTWLSIFDAQPFEQVPSGFRAVRIALHAGVESELRWAPILEWATSLVEAGLWLWWDLELGLFDGLHQPLNEPTQYGALAVALRHFEEKVWPDFEASSIGINLFRGSVPVGPQVEYLMELACLLPTAAAVFLCLNPTQEPGRLKRVLMTSPDLFPHLHLVVKGAEPGQECLSWGEGHSRFGYLGRSLDEGKAVSCDPFGLCLPSLERYQSGWEEAFVHLSAVPRLIPEAFLTHSWDGLERLVVFSEGLSCQGRRKLQGFCAAGGALLTIGQPLGLPQESSFTHDAMDLSICDCH